MSNSRLGKSHYSWARGQHLGGGAKIFGLVAKGGENFWTRLKGGGQKILDASQMGRGAKHFRLDLFFTDH